MSRRVRNDPVPKSESEEEMARKRVMTKEEPNTREGMVSDPDGEVGGEAEGKVDVGLNEATVAQDEMQGDLEADIEATTGSGNEVEADVGADAELDPEPELEPEAESQTEPYREPDSEPVSDDDTQSELQSVQDELHRMRDQHLRLAADFENHRKRANADLAGVWGRAQADLVRSLVEGLDDLQRVSQFTSDDTTVDVLIEGVDLVERNLLKALTEAGLEVLNPLGERFDPNIMEAMMRVPTEEEGQDHTVHQVFQKGYMFKDQLVRPARVSVYMDED